MQGIVLLLIYPLGIFCPLAVTCAAIGTSVGFAECFDAHKKRVAVKLDIVKRIIYHFLLQRRCILLPLALQIILARLLSVRIEFTSGKAKRVKQKAKSWKVKGDRFFLHVK